MGKWLKWKLDGNETESGKNVFYDEENFTQSNKDG